MAEIKNMFVEVTIGEYIIRPHPTPQGEVFIEIMKVVDEDCEHNPVGPQVTVDVGALFR